ncbi:MAG: hypothetical protein NWE92_07655 [Candidatus Bathyarchaeota archaeon]|nr:hypothetical protein [Candidatus Bathyarchaeota archaeon]
MQVPEVYYQFVMDNAPYLYVDPQTGPDLTWGKAAFAAGFGVDFLYEAYFNLQFEDRSSEIEAKIVELADWLLTQQVQDRQKATFGGFVCTENGVACYSVDVGRVVPALLKAYELTSDGAYLDAAKLAVGTFLYNMQHRPSEQGVHDRYHGGFARAVDDSGVWQPQMDVESLYNLVALGLLTEADPANKAAYQVMVQDAANFYRPGIEALALFFDPQPAGDGGWHRVGLGDDTVYDDSIAYALLGLNDYEGYSGTVKNVYEALGAIAESPLYPAYNPAVCWAGYLNVKTKTPACNYYDAVTAGILGKIRQRHDQPSYAHSAQTISAHAEAFMFWGPRHADYAPVEVKQAMATVCWLGIMFADYEAPLTRFVQVLGSKGENLTLHPQIQTGDSPVYGEATTIKAIVLPQKTEELLLEPGYLTTDYLTLHVYAPLRRHDKVTRNGLDYEVTTTQDFTLKDQVLFRKATLRRLHQ